MHKQEMSEKKKNIKSSRILKYWTEFQLEDLALFLLTKRKELLDFAVRADHNENRKKWKTV